VPGGLGDGECLPSGSIEELKGYCLRRDDALAIIKECKLYGINQAFCAKVHFQPVGFIGRPLRRPAVWWMHGVTIVAIIYGFQGCLRIGE
jgi:hypothetical protein